MFAKLFSSWGSSSGNKSIPEQDEDSSVSPALIPNDFMRVFILKESSKKEHQLMYDSQMYEPKTYIKIEERTAKSYVVNDAAVKNVALLGEVMFGAIPLSLQGTTTKLHCIKNANQILITSLFRYAYLPKTNTSVVYDRKSTSSSSAAMGGSFRANRQPFPRNHGSVNGLTALEDQYQMGNADASMQPAASNHASFSNFAQMKAYHRPRARSVAAAAVVPRIQKTSFAIGVLFTYSEDILFTRDFIFSHFAIIEHRLKLLIKDFTSSLRDCDILDSPDAKVAPPDDQLIRFVQDFKTSIYDFITAPRLQRPIWLHVVTFPAERQAVLINFLDQLKTAHKTLNEGKGRNLLSTFITTVLTHNLAWLKTVQHVPTNTSPEDITLNTNSANSLAKVLRELYGVSRKRSARTLVVGSDGYVVRRLLLILSYFLRCGEVFQSYYPEIEIFGEDERRIRKSPSRTTSGETEIAEDKSASKTVKIIDLPEVGITLDGAVKKGAFSSFGRSMFASYCNRYHGAFVSMGLSSDDDYFPALARDLKASVEEPITGDKNVTSSVCILANTNQYNCRLVIYDPVTLNSSPGLVVKGRTYSDTTLRISPCSSLVNSLIFNTAHLWHLKFPSDVCIMYLEDRLSEIVSKAVVFKEYLAEEHRRTSTQSFSIARDIAPTLQLDEGDVTLLSAIAMQLDPSIEIEVSDANVLYKCQF